MADYRVVDADQLDADLTVVADAIREKGGTSEPLAFPNGMADAIMGIVSGGGLMETGELVTNTKNFYKLSIPVSSKKRRLVLYPKELSQLIQNPNIEPYVARRIGILLAIDDVGLIQIGLSTGYDSNSGMTRGDCYIYDTTDNATGKAVFDDNSIEVTIGYSPFNIGNFYWFAW